MTVTLDSTIAILFVVKVFMTSAMTTYGPYIFAGLLAFTVIAIFRAIWLMLPHRDEVAERLADYGKTDFSEMLNENAIGSRRRKLSLLERLENGFGFGPGLAKALSQSDLPLTVAEFMLVVIIAAGLGFLIGSLRVNALFGIIVGALFAALPIFYLRIAQERRRRTFVNQLPDVLTLMIGALQAGNGLSQAISVLVDKMPSPSSVEFGRVNRAMNLGLSLQQALADMSERVGSEDLTLVVTAINVQYESGGNLAQVLETIEETIRERIRILREVRVLTAQQRLTGYILAAVPIFLAVMISLMNPAFFDPFFEPGFPRLLPYIAGGLILIGFLIINRIVDIKV